MTDLKFTSPSGEIIIKVEGTGTLGTLTPKAKLHIKVNEPETPITEIEELKAQKKTTMNYLKKILSLFIQGYKDGQQS